MYTNAMPKKHMLEAVKSLHTCPYGVYAAKVPDSLSGILTELDTNYFIKCSRVYIVNFVSAVLSAYHLSGFLSATWTTLTVMSLQR